MRRRHANAHKLTIVFAFANIPYLTAAASLSASGESKSILVRPVRSVCAAVRINHEHSYRAIPHLSSTRVEPSSRQCCP